MYQGTFVNTGTMQIPEWPDVIINVATNEKGESYYDLRNAEGRPEFVVLVHPETGYVTGCNREGNFSFAYPLKVYFMDKVPEDSIENPGVYRWDDEFGWRKCIDVAAWKYNQELEAKDEIIMAATTGDFEKVKQIQEWVATAKAYKGNGYEPPLPEKPY